MQISALTLAIGSGLLAFMISVSPVQAQGTAEAHVKQAEAFHQIGRLGDAERHYNLAVKQAFALGQNNPKIPEVLASAASFYIARDNNGKAEQLYMQAIDYKIRGVGRDHIDLAKLYMGLGLLYYGEYKYTQAEEQYRLALNIYEKKLRQDRNIPNFNKKEINLYLANCLEEIGRCQEKTNGANAAAAYRAKAGRIKANPFGDYYN